MASSLAPVPMPRKARPSPLSSSMSIGGGAVAGGAMPGSVPANGNPFLADFKAKNPAYANVSDRDLADALYRKYYSGIPRGDFDAKIGLEPARLVGRTDQLEQRFVFRQAVAVEDRFAKVVEMPE